MHKPPTSGPHRGVPGLTLCLRCPSGRPSPTAQCLTGQPSRRNASVHLSTPRGRPPACHRRGRRPSNPPSRDRADGATLGRPRHEPRRTRRPALRDTMQRGPLPASRNAPLPRGHAIASASRLMGRRDARPHNARPTAGAPGRHATAVPEGTGSPTTGSPTLPRRRSTSTSGFSASPTARNAITQPPVSYTHLTLPTNIIRCRSRGAPGE